MVDAIGDTLLASIVAKLTAARAYCERADTVNAVDMLNLALIQCVALERHEDGAAITVRVRP